MNVQRKNPKLPSHEIIQVYPDGSALRNDEVELAVANSNPWYVLATIYGEQEGFPFDQDLATQNRRAWNAWVFQGLSESVQAKFAGKYGLSSNEIAELSAVNLGEIEQLFQERLENPKAQLPRCSETCIFTKTYFPKPVSFENYIFMKNVDFRSAAFSGATDFSAVKFNGNTDFNSATFGGSVDFFSASFNGAAYFISTVFCGTASLISSTFNESADFNTATFNGTADFRSATFERIAYFRSTIFNGTADFITVIFNDTADFISTVFNGTADYTSATFNGDASFRSATFSGSADFISATLNHDADFRSAIFNGTAYFRSAIFNDYASFSFAKFKSKTIFDEAKFQMTVPQFHAAELHDDTSFTLPNNFLQNWPPLGGERVMPAVDQVRAYNRLRLYMNETVQAKKEQYFYRQEMRCKMMDATWHQLPAFKFFELFSDFGCSVLRPLIGLIAVVIWGALVAALYMVKAEIGLLSEVWAWSLANTIPIFGFGQLYYGGVLAELPAWLTIVSGIQAVLGIILLFLLGLGLRNLFRMG